MRSLHVGTGFGLNEDGSEVELWAGGELGNDSATTEYFVAKYSTHWDDVGHLPPFGGSEALRRIELRDVPCAIVRDPALIC